MIVKCRKLRWARCLIGKGKSKVDPMLFLTEHHATKVFCGMEVYLHSFLTSALDGGEWLTSRPGRFTPTERTLAPEPIWTGGGGEEKNSQPFPDSNPPIIHPEAQRYTTELSRLGKAKMYVYTILVGKPGSGRFGRLSWG
jgi:hypothetical protein